MLENLEPALRQPISPSLHRDRVPRPQDVLVPGTLAMCNLGDDCEQWYFRYVPTQPRRSAPLLVCVHGITRNAWEIATHFLPLCEAHGVAMVAPIFAKDEHRCYQFMGPERRVRRADEVLQSIVLEMRSLFAMETEKCCLFGYSGGAQFTHRYAFAHPERVARYALGAAGWYTLPDITLPYPLGVGAARDGSSRPMDPARFLRVPARVLVGERDTMRDEKLNQSAMVDALQGRTRVERAAHWIEAMKTAAERCGYPHSVDLRIIPKSAHSFKHCCNNGMAEDVFRFLYGQDV